MHGTTHALPGTSIWPSDLKHKARLPRGGSVPQPNNKLCSRPGVTRRGAWGHKAPAGAERRPLCGAPQPGRAAGRASAQRRAAATQPQVPHGQGPGRPAPARLLPTCAWSSPSSQGTLRFLSVVPIPRHTIDSLLGEKHSATHTSFEASILNTQISPGVHKHQSHWSLAIMLTKASPPTFFPSLTQVSLPISTCELLSF